MKLKYQDYLGLLSRKVCKHLGKLEYVSGFTTEGLFIQIRRVQMIICPSPQLWEVNSWLDPGVLEDIWVTFVCWSEIIVRITTIELESQIGSGMKTAGGARGQHLVFHFQDQVHIVIKMDSKNKTMDRNLFLPEICNVDYLILFPEKNSQPIQVLPSV